MIDGDVSKVSCYVDIRYKMCVEYCYAENGIDQRDDEMTSEKS